MNLVDKPVTVLANVFIVASAAAVEAEIVLVLTADDVVTVEMLDLENKIRVI